MGAHGSEYKSVVSKIEYFTSKDEKNMLKELLDPEYELIKLLKKK